MPEIESRKIVCPVCRASQVPMPECRRCQADLSLYLLALRSAANARNALEQARRDGDQQRAKRTFDYLKWLDPKALG